MTEEKQKEQEIKDPCVVPKDWNIWQRINWVRSQEYYVKKDAAVQNYMGVTHDAVTAAIHNRLVQAGIIIFPDLVSSRVVDAGQTKSQTQIIRYEATYIVRFVNCHNAEDSVAITIESHANDQGDKAPGKCCSYSVKTATLKMFWMETGVNDEGRIDAKIAETKGQEPITPEQVTELEDLIQNGGLDRDAVIGWMQKAMRVESIKDLNQTGYAESKRVIEAKVKKAGKET